MSKFRQKPFEPSGPSSVKKLSIGKMGEMILREMGGGGFKSIEVRSVLLFWKWEKHLKKLLDEYVLSSQLAPVIGTFFLHPLPTAWY